MAKNLIKSSIEPVEEDPEEDVKPPPILARMLEWTKHRQADSRELYDDFLIYAERATQDMNAFQVAVDGNYKLKDVKYRPSTKESFTNCLIIVFQFYCKLRQNVGQTFADTESILEQMSFKEIEILCRDFHIVPRLLTKDDIRYLWENMVDAQGNKTTFRLLDFELFKIYFVRMALWTYHKPGLKKLILTLDGFMPNPVEIIKCFATYCHLQDSLFIHTFLRTVSRKTQADYNYRSKGESNDRTRLEILADSNTRQNALASRRAARSRKMSTASAVASPRRTSLQPIASTGFPTTDPDQPRPITREKTNIFGDQMKDEVITRPARPDDVVRLIPRSYFPEKRSLLPQHMLDKLTPQHDVLLLRAFGSGDEDHDAHNMALDDAPPSARFASEHDDMDDSRTEMMSVASHSSVASIFLDNSLEAQADNLNALYDTRLVKELERYAYIPGKANSTDWIPTHGPMVDLGLVQPGCKVVINMRVWNNSLDEVQIDVTARNFQSIDTAQRTYAKALIPGFSRNLITTFTVPEDNRTVLGFIDVAILSARLGGGGCVSCPIFYRVDNLVEKDTFPKCTGYSLPDLLAQRNQQAHLPGQKRHPPTMRNFEAKKFEGTKWSTRTGKQTTLALSLRR
eukprot:gene743-807_t